MKNEPCIIFTASAITLARRSSLQMQAHQFEFSPMFHLEVPLIAKIKIGIIITISACLNCR
jgi:hypothetical protein